MVAEQNGMRIHRLTAEQQAPCRRIFDEYKIQTRREPDPWRRLGQAYAEMCRVLYLSPEKLARRACVPVAATENLEGWSHRDRFPTALSILTIGEYFGITKADIYDFIHEPVSVPRRGAAMPVVRLFFRCARVAALGLGHRAHIVRPEAVAERITPIAFDAMALSGWYSGQSGAKPTSPWGGGAK